MAKRTDPGPGLFDVPAELYRFLLVISPSKDLSALVSRLKTALAEQIGSFSGRHSIPHITLFYADLPLECERDICEGVANGVIRHKAFTMRYEGIGHFEDKKTIYVDPVDKELIAPVRSSIVRHVRSFPRMKGIKPTDRPHLTIAAGLKPKVEPRSCRRQHMSTSSPAAVKRGSNPPTASRALLRNAMLQPGMCSASRSERRT